MYQRREVLKVALAGAVAPALTFDLFSPAFDLLSPALAQSPGEPFNPSQIIDMARALASKPYKAPANDLPEPFANLTYEQYAAIQHKRDKAIWALNGTGFALEPLHRGYVNSMQMQLNVVAEGTTRRVSYDPNRYDLGKLTAPAEAREIGFSGLRILKANEDKSFTELAVFQGASIFRSHAGDQPSGIMARGLAIRTADPKGEELPLFRALWIERPTLANNALVLHAVLDSESLAGAYRFTIRPGDATIIDIECTLFPRVALDHFGLAAMQASYLYGPMDRRRGDDVRPGVYEATGLRMLNGNDEWLWRPLSNRDMLQVSAFVDENPKGFGFLQTDRSFERFLDDEQHWESKPSLWVEPLGDWGPGWITLMEVPADSQLNQNMIAYWRPKAALAAGSENSFAFRQFWCWNPPEKPPLALARLSRSGRAPNAPANSRKRRFLVEFSGDNLGEFQSEKQFGVKLSTSQGQISNLRKVFSSERKFCRVLFDLDPGNETLAELRLVLETQGKPISETWLYRWTP